MLRQKLFKGVFLHNVIHYCKDTNRIGMRPAQYLKEQYNLMEPFSSKISSQILEVIDDGSRHIWYFPPQNYMNMDATFNGKHIKIQCYEDFRKKEYWTFYPLHDKSPLSRYEPFLIHRPKTQDFVENILADEEFFPCISTVPVLREDLTSFVSGMKYEYLDDLTNEQIN